MKKRAILILGIVALMLVNFSLGTAQKSALKQATPIPADQIGPVEPPVMEKDECYLWYTDWTPAYFYSGWKYGDKVAIYFDPEDCGYPTNYPFQLTDVEFFLYDFAAMGQVDVRFSVEVVCPDICDGPGIEIWKSQTYNITQFWPVYPDPVQIYFEDIVCLDKPFFFNVEYMSDYPQGSMPSLLFDPEVPPVDTCYQWVWVGQPAWYEWYDFWSPPPYGWVNLSISGLVADQADCGWWYWKPDTTEAPSGMPDFDQNQDAWVAFCGPTAVANCLWWFDAVPAGMTPPDLIELLAGYFSTTSGGTYVDSIQAGLDRYFEDYGFALKETTYWIPDFYEMEDSLKVCQDIILLLGFWWWDGYEWWREGGHYVTMAGVNSEKKEIAISDPDRDQCVQYPWWPGRVRPPTHLPWGAYPPEYHNDPSYVSHDVYVSLLYPEWPSPGSEIWELADYCVELWKYSNVNIPERFKAVTKQAPKHYEYFHTEVEAAVMICPKCTPSIDVEKKVWDEENHEWVDYADIDSCTNAEFRIAIHNDGTCCDLEDIFTYDFLSSSFEFIDADPPPDDIYTGSWGTELYWYSLAGIVPPCSTVTITVTAHVIGPPCHIDTNYVYAQAYCVTQGLMVYDEDWAEVHATRPEPHGWYWKDPYPDYAPSGMPDIDQKQDNWYKYETGAWTFCGPVAVANCFKWFDSKYNVPPGFPGDIVDQFPLVRQYIDVVGGMICPWDDHDPFNVDHPVTPWRFAAQGAPPPTLPQPFVPGPIPPGPMTPWGELVERLAWYFNTDGVQTGYCAFSGTYVTDMQAGIDKWLESERFPGGEQMFIRGDVNEDGVVDAADIAACAAGGPFSCDDAADVNDDGILNMADCIYLNDFLFLAGPPPPPPFPDCGVDYTPDGLDCADFPPCPWSNTLADTLCEVTTEMPTFAYVESLVEKCEDVILLLGFWYEDPPGEWWRVGGHYVTVAGVNSEQFMIAFSDPYYDAAEWGWPGRVGNGWLIPHGPPGHAPDVHNDEGNVSHDIYGVHLDSPSPGGLWWLPDYPPPLKSHDRSLFMTNFFAQNVPEEFVSVTREWDGKQAIHTEVEYCVHISPWDYRGDVNLGGLPDGVVDINDVVFLLNFLFKGGPPPVPMSEGDVTCNGVVTIDDVVFLINYLFKNGPVPRCCDP